MTFTTVAVRSMRIVADTNESMSSVSCINKAVGTGSKDHLILDTSVPSVSVSVHIEMVAISFVRQSLLLTVGLIESVNSGAVMIN